MYGRRRVGKTFLVKRTFNEQFDFWFTGMFETGRAIQLRQFGKELSKCSGKNVPPPKDWFEAFDMLQEHLLSLGKEMVVVFLDEIPWADTKTKKAVLCTFVTTYGVKRNLYSGIVSSEVTMDDLFREKE